MRNISGLFLIFICVSIIISAGCTNKPAATVSPTLSQTPSISSIVNTTSDPKTNPITQIPENIVCLIYHKEQAFTYNKDSTSFNLVNPPMYINYTILDTKQGIDGKYASYYTITISDTKTGVIYNQLGFGKNTLQGGYFNYGFGGSDVIKIIKTGDLQIVTEGKDITINTEIWVKPDGNLDSSFNISSTKCIIWPETYQKGVLHSSLGVNIPVQYQDLK